MPKIKSNRFFGIIVIIAIVGSLLVIASMAASTTIAIEPEVNAPENLIINDSSASGGRAVIFGKTPSTGNISPPVSADAGKQWVIKFNEDFNGNSIDLNKWTPCFSWAYTYEDCTVSFYNGREAYEQSQIQLSNGTAKLVAEPLSPKKWGKDYKSGLLSTTNKPASTTGGANGPSLYKFTYGYVEAKMKLPRKKRVLFSILDASSRKS